MRLAYLFHLLSQPYLDSHHYRRQDLHCFQFHLRHNLLFLKNQMERHLHYRQPHHYHRQGRFHLESHPHQCQDLY